MSFNLQSTYRILILFINGHLSLFRGNHGYKRLSVTFIEERTWSYLVLLSDFSVLHDFQKYSKLVLDHVDIVRTITVRMFM